MIRLLESNDDDNHSCSLIHRLVESDGNDNKIDGRIRLVRVDDDQTGER